MILAGQRLGGFEIVECIGQGGMGSVYRATQTSLQRSVAIKTLQPAWAANPEYVARFHREAVAAAGLSHQNLVQVHAAGETDGIHWFAMEFVEGESADVRLARAGRMEPGEVIAMGLHVANALGYAWDRARLIHRDIKPGNIFVSGYGEVKLGDLGLAKLAEQDLSITSVGVTVGTPHYMSPEQAEGRKDLDLRADIYSLGCTLYHLASGQPPYTGDSGLAVAMKHVSAPPPDIRNVIPAYPRALAEVILKMTQKDPAVRQQGYEEVSEDLRAAYDFLSGGTTPSSTIEDRYVVGEPLGEEKIGRVFRAEDPRLEREVRLLVLHQEFLSDAAACAALEREVERLKEAPHPNVLQVFEFETFQDGTLLAMEWTEGFSLLELLRARQKLSADEAILLLRQAAVGVDHALERGLTGLEFGLGQALLHFAEPFEREALLGQSLAQWPAFTLKLYPLGVKRDVSSSETWIGSRTLVGEAFESAAEGSNAPGGYIRSLAALIYELLGGSVSPTMRAGAGLAASRYTPVATLGENGNDTLKRALDPETSFATAREFCDALAQFNAARMTGSAPKLAMLRSKVSSQPVASGTAAGAKRRVSLTAWVAGGVALLAAAAAAFVHFMPGKGGGEAGGKRAAPPATAPPAVVAINRQPDVVTGASTPAPAHEAPPSSTPAPSGTPTPTQPIASSSTPSPSATPKPLSEIEKWLALVDGPQQAAFQKQALKPFEAGVADLRSRYLAVLDADIVKASAAGQLTDALAWRKERQAFEKAKSVAEDDDATPAGVKTLRAAFRQELAKLDQEKTSKAKGLLAQYDAILAKNQILLTQQKRLDEALLLQNRRDEIARAWVGASPVGAGDPGAAGSPQVEKPGSSKSPTSTTTMNALSATMEQPFVNTLGMKFVPVPIGSGPTAGQRVLFSVWDTRVQDYKAFAKSNKVDDAWTKQEQDGVPAGREKDHPVVSVSWDEAQGFCQWLTKHEIAQGKLPKGVQYRLPTDEEWSWAVGMPPEAGATPAEKDQKNQADYPWGKDYPVAKNVGNYADETFHARFPNGEWISGYTDGYPTTSPVETFPANAYGLYDMGGNVWQWCEDWFDDSHKYRALRGGSWGTFYRELRLSSARRRDIPGSRDKHSGFRCVLGVSEPTAPASPAVPPVAATISVTPAAAPSTVTPAAATRQTPFVNSLEMKFVPVPILGGPTGGQRVLFSVWDTRVQDYEVFAQETKQRLPNPKFEQGPTHPAVQVSWDDAQLFCQWLTVRDRAAGRLPSGWGYRLPSDHEWSCAVGLGAKDDGAKLPAEKDANASDTYPWGAKWPPPMVEGNYAGQELQPFGAKSHDNQVLIPGYNDGFVNTSPVGSFKANQFGLFDMGGNVWQWCDDWFDKNHNHRVLRGASWYESDRYNLMALHHMHYSPDYRLSNVGFRCVAGISAP